MICGSLFIASYPASGHSASDQHVDDKMRGFLRGFVFAPPVRCQQRGEARPGNTKFLARHVGEIGKAAVLSAQDADHC